MVLILLDLLPGGIAGVDAPELNPTTDFCGAQPISSL